MRVGLKKPITLKKKSLLRSRKKPLRKNAGTKKKVTLKGTYNKAYNAGFDKGHQTGYQQGKYDGEASNTWKDGIDGFIDTLIPDYEILPDFSAEQIIAAGVEHLRPQYIHLLNPDELGGRIIEALDNRTPFSIVRLGDGELLTLAQGTVLSIEQVKAEGHFLGYAGVDVPDYEARDQLIEAVRKASVIGVPKLRIRNYQPLFHSVFRSYEMDYRSMTLTDSLINYYLYQAGYVSRITAGRRVLLIGNHAERLADLFRSNGVKVSGVIAPVRGVKDVARVVNEAKHVEFDLALVASGISAVLISTQLASELGKVAVDFGHLADSMLKGEAPFK